MLTVCTLCSTILTGEPVFSIVLCIAVSGKIVGSGFGTSAATGTCAHMFAGILRINAPTSIIVTLFGNRSTANGCTAIITSDNSSSVFCTSGFRSSCYFVGMRTGSRVSRCLRHRGRCETDCHNQRQQKCRELFLPKFFHCCSLHETPEISLLFHYKSMLDGYIIFLPIT